MKKQFIAIGAAGVLTIGLGVRALAQQNGTPEAQSFKAQEKVQTVVYDVACDARTFRLNKSGTLLDARRGEAYLESMRQMLSSQGKEIQSVLGFGSPAKELIRIGREEHLDLLVMGSHGHRGLKDLIFGTTVSPVRHALNIPVFIVQ